VFIFLNVAAFAILFSLEGQFEALSGAPTFDTQNDLTSARLLQQLPLYQGEARDAYYRFVAFDFVFPLVAALFLTVWWIVFLQLNTFPLAARLLRWGLPFLPLLTTLWDYLENVCFLLILNSGSTVSTAVIEAALLFKQLKLAFLSVCGIASGLLILFLAINVLSRILSRSKVAA
jgi:hypothetical protein